MGDKMVSSMTGFASETGQTQLVSWVFEIKSVNGRGLDIRLNLPSGCEALELDIRNAIKKAFARGNMQVSLNIRDLSDAASRVKIDTQLLNSLSRRARIMDRGNRTPGRTLASDLLGMKGVISSERTTLEITPDSDAGRAILESIGEAIKQLSATRDREGEALSTVLARIVLEMAEEVSKAKDTADAQPAMIHARMMNRIADVLDDTSLSSDRLEQEVALLVSKADVTEELDRLNAHFDEASRLLSADHPIGRKLEFLSQELLREANTIGSKASSLDMTRHSLALKSLIDQFKEQAANVE